MAETDLMAEMQSMVDEHDFMEGLDAEVTDAEPGRVAMVLPYREEFANPASDAMHGGLVATMIDHASGMAVYSATVDRPDVGGGPTIDLRISYIRPVVGDLHVEAEIVSFGRSIAFTTATATTLDADGREETVASSEGTFSVGGE